VHDRILDDNDSRNLLELTEEWDNALVIFMYLRIKKGWKSTPSIRMSSMLVFVEQQSWINKATDV